MDEEKEQQRLQQLASTPRHLGNPLKEDLKRDFTKMSGEDILAYFAKLDAAIPDLVKKVQNETSIPAVMFDQIAQNVAKACWGSYHQLTTKGSGPPPSYMGTSRIRFAGGLTESWLRKNFIDLYGGNLIHHKGYFTWVLPGSFPKVYNSYSKKHISFLPTSTRLFSYLFLRGIIWTYLSLNKTLKLQA